MGYTPKIAVLPFIFNNVFLYTPQYIFTLCDIRNISFHRKQKFHAARTIFG